MASTSQITVTQAAWTAVVAQTPCTEIVVQENRGVANWPNGDFLVLKAPSQDGLNLVSPPASPVPSRKQSASQYIFRGDFSKGSLAGHLQMVANVTTTFDQDESTPPHGR